jgi:DNA-binding PadR family transcriptional regulator
LDRHFAPSDDLADCRHQGHHHGQRGHRFGGRRGGLPFEHGELRLIALAVIAEPPRDGDEFVTAIEPRMSGSDSPGPRAINPALSRLKDNGYGATETGDAGRARHRIAAAGDAFLTADRAVVAAGASRIGSAGASETRAVPAPVQRAAANLKMALRLRLRRDPLDQTAAKTVTAALHTSAQAMGDNG